MTADENLNQHDKMPDTPQLDKAADGGSQHPLVLRLRSKICDEDNDGQLLDDAADEIQKLWNALEQFYAVNTRFGIGGFGMMEYQKANFDAREALQFPKNHERTTTMSTQAAIIARTEDGTGYRGIYLHHDGYLSHAGYLLAEHYTTEEQVQALIDKGGLSSLDTTPEECDAYADRGESKVIHAGHNSEAVESRIGHAGHVYLWEGQEWRHNGHRINLPPTEAQIEQAERDAGWDSNP